jgi:ATP-dependent DNA helicase RecQ
MMDLLKRHFGYDAFRPLQEEAVRTVLSGGDAFVLMPTGGGKSLCYQLPALALPGLTLVVSPLIALMKDQVDALAANGVPAAFLNSALSADEADAVERGALSGQLKILYVAPERLASPGFRHLLGRLRVSLIAVDEAHCISEWGHDFRPDYRNLRGLRDAFPGVPVIALTATATPRVREDIVGQLSLAGARTFLSSFNRPNLFYSVRPKAGAAGQLVDLLRSARGKPAIVYCFSRGDTEELAGRLRDEGFDALPYHAGLDRDVRRVTQEKFIRDQISVIVATIAFGMGIDKPDVRLVVHMDLPKTLEGYYQETGRAGRDGLPSECVLFYAFGDRRKQEYFIGQIADDTERVLASQKLARVVEYCETAACRRAFLLRYFGEGWEETSCGACDICVAPARATRDATELAQKILSAVLRTGETFGAAYVCDVLRGSAKERVVGNGHHLLSVYGIARDVPAPALREAMVELQRAGYLERGTGDYPTLRVAAAGKKALVGRERIDLPVTEAAVRSVRRPAKTDGGSATYDPELFEILRRERRAIAEELNVPPFVVFGDRTLHEMAFFFPRSAASLAHIFGVGAAKLERFGDAFLRLIGEYADARGLAERTSPSRDR